MSDSAVTFDALPALHVCSICGRRSPLLPGESRDCGLVGFAMREPCPGILQPILWNLRAPREIVFCFICSGELVERRFAFLAGEMPLPQVGDEIRLPLAEDDPIRAVDEFETNGFVRVTKRAIDFVDGEIWCEVDFELEAG